jgi:hypothetical protein
VDAIERFENVSGSLKCTEIQAIQDTLENSELFSSRKTGRIMTCA